MSETKAGTQHPEMTHAERLEALSGLLMGMFVALLSSTVVSNALPRIISDLHGSESAYTWVVTATLLATTVSTPIWGKLSDIYSKKLLVQLGLVIFVLGSIFAGLAHSTEWLIAFRAVQGIGAGGLMALVQVVIAAMIPPRERGRYSGYIGAVFGLATLLGPLLGGLLVDTSWLGWRWCFYVGAPFALIAIVLLQKTLHLPVIERTRHKIDYIGATLITAGVSLLLIWVSLAGHQFGWASKETAMLVTGGILLCLIAIVVESRAEDPVIPLRLFKNSTVSLSTFAAVCVGIALFGATVFLSLYFQISRGDSATQSGLSTLPMVVGLAIATTVSGRIITNTGHWKRFLVLGGVLLTSGLLLMGTISATTPYWHLVIFMFIMGAGTGMLMQNLVLAVQNTVSMRDIGAGSSVVAFFRSLGGAVGVSTLGALVSHRVTTYVTNGFQQHHLPVPSGSQSSGIPDLHKLPDVVRVIIQHAYGNAVGDLFLAAAPFGLIALIAVLFIKEVPLRQSNVTSDEKQEVAAL